MASGGPFIPHVFGALSHVAGTLLVLVGKLVSLLQTCVGIEAPGRRLTPREAEVLERVFGDSLATGKIRIAEGRSGLFGVVGRCFALGHTIYMKDVAAGDRDRILVHEATHVWQFERRGCRYAAEALAAQHRCRLRGQCAYDWWDPGIQRGSRRWESWNAEAQAQFLEDLHAHGYFEGPGARFAWRGIDYTEVAEEALRALRHRSHFAKGWLPQR